MEFPNMSSEDNGACFVAQCNKARIFQQAGLRTLEVYLTSDAPIANHGNPALQGKEGFMLIQELFGKQESMDWGDERKKLMSSDMDFQITIATDVHPVRWTAGRSLVVINNYAALHLRPQYGQPSVIRLADLGGFGCKEDLFDPGKGVHREVIEELLILSAHERLVIPKFQNPRGIRYSPLAQIAAQETGLFYAGVESCVALERTDLAQESRIKIYMDGESRKEESLLFRYDPYAHCGLDILAPIEYRVDQKISQLSLGFGEYWHDESQQKIILGPQQDMALVKIDDLLEEFDKERPRFLEGIVCNAYTHKAQSRRFHPHLITGSVLAQLEVMKRANYNFSL